MITRQEHLYRIAAFCRLLDETLRATGLGPAQAFEAFRSSVSAECIGCGIPVSGEELFALSQPPSPERATAKIGRLRLGDCARKDCDACYYRVSFADQAQLDWPSLIAQVDVLNKSQAGPRSVSGFLKLSWQGLFTSRMLPRVGLALSAVLLVLFIRQWHQGGRIPFIREPEKFHVDTVQPEGTTD